MITLLLSVLALSSPPAQAASGFTTCTLSIHRGHETFSAYGTVGADELSKASIQVSATPGVVAEVFRDQQDLALVISIRDGESRMSVRVLAGDPLPQRIFLSTSRNVSSIHCVRGAGN